MKIQKLGIVGHFGFDYELTNGQTVKTKNLSNAFKRYTDIEISEIDTFGWRKHPFRLYKKIKKAFANCDAIIMLPAHNGVKIFAPLFAHLKRKYDKKIVYDVIGGWLPEFLQDKPRLAKTLLSFDGIWVETETMKSQLEAYGFNNIFTVSNFKELNPLSESDLICFRDFPLKLCTFSRVAKGKGIETAIDVITKVNEKCGFNAFSLDIYGPIADEEREWFSNMQKKLSKNIVYNGCVNSGESVGVLSKYDLLVFPTHFYTEGIPGTIIDAYAAGVPVISAKWESFSDVVDEGITGLGYEFENIQEFESILLMLAKKPEILFEMKSACIKKADKYVTSTAIKYIIEIINA